MRTVTFKSVLWGVARRLGMDPATTLTVTDAAAITEYIRTAFRYGWTFAPWPQLARCEQRTPVEGVVAFDQYGETAIETVLGVYDADPLAPGGTAVAVDWRLGRDGITLAAADPVYIVFRCPEPEWTSDTPAAGATLAAGGTYYEPSDGHCYTVLAGFTYGADTPVLDTDIARMDFPAFLAEAVKCGAHALALQEEGQFATAMLPADSMDAQLLHEFRIVEGQQGHCLRLNAVQA